MSSEREQSLAGLRFNSLTPFSVDGSSSRGWAPDEDIPEIVEIYKEVEAKGGLTFANTYFNLPDDKHYFHSDILKWRREHPEEELQLTLGMVSAAEYKALYEKRYLWMLGGFYGSVKDRVVGDFLKEPGDTKVVASAPAREELDLATKVYDLWRTKMREVGKQALFGVAASHNGFGRFVPTKNSRGPWTVQVSNADGTVYERTFSRNFGGFTIEHK